MISICSLFYEIDSEAAEAGSNLLKRIGKQLVQKPIEPVTVGPQAEEALNIPQYEPPPRNIPLNTPPRMWKPEYRY